MEQTAPKIQRSIAEVPGKMPYTPTIQDASPHALTQSRTVIPPAKTGRLAGQKAIVVAFNVPIAAHGNRLLKTIQQSPSPSLKAYTGASDEQEAVWRAVLDGSGHVIVDSVAGSGKSWTVFGAVARLVKLGVGVEVRTYHSLGLDTIKANTARRVDVVKPAYIRGLVEKASQDQAAPAQVRGMDFGERRKAVGYAVKILGMCKSGLIDVRSDEGFELLMRTAREKGLDTSAREWHIGVYLASSVLHEQVEDAERGSGPLKVVYDDMCWLPMQLGWEAPRFDFVFVDELQDTSLDQQALALAAVGIGGKRGRLIGVGDSRQAVYAFRGAATGAMARMSAALRVDGQRGVEELRLSVTRRCPKSAVGLAKVIVPWIEALPDAIEGKVRVTTEGKAVQEIAAKLRKKEYGEGSARQVMVICRINADLIGFAYELIKAGVAASVMGREIGEGLIELVEKLTGDTQDQFADSVEDWYDREAAKARKLKDKEERDERLAKLYDSYLCVVALAETVVCVEDEEANAPIGGWQGARGGSGFKDAVLARLNELFSDETTNRVVCGTIHRTKGLEARTVYILRPDILGWSKQAKIEEDKQQERNLAYIAVTRWLEEGVFVEADGVGVPEVFNQKVGG